MAYPALKDSKVRRLVPKRSFRNSPTRPVQIWGNESSEQFLKALRKEQNTLADHSEGYMRIGETLTTAETVSLVVGIPILWATKRVRALRKRCDMPIDEFLRVNLVGVPTRVVEFYIQELDDLSIEANSLDRLSIQRPTRFERLAPLVVALPIFFFLFFLIFSLSLSPPLAALGSFFITSLAILGLVVLSSNTYRRISFSLFLSREILRRRGENTPGGPNLRMCPTS